MDTQRLVLFLALSLVVLLLWDAWNQRNNPEQVITSTTTVAGHETTQIPSDSGEALPEDRPAMPESTPEAPEKPSARVQKALTSGQRIHVVTDIYDIDIETQGGDLRRAYLRKYPVHPFYFAVL